MNHVITKCCAKYRRSHLFKGSGKDEPWILDFINIHRCSAKVATYSYSDQLDCVKFGHCLRTSPFLTLVTTGTGPKALPVYMADGWDKLRALEVPAHLRATQWYGAFRY